MIGEAVAEQRPVEAAVKEPVGIPEGSFDSGKPLRPMAYANGENLKASI